MFRGVFLHPKVMSLMRIKTGPIVLFYRWKKKKEVIGRKTQDGHSQLKLTAPTGNYEKSLRNTIVLEIQIHSEKCEMPDVVIIHQIH